MDRSYGLLGISSAQLGFVRAYLWQLQRGNQPTAGSPEQERVIQVAQAIFDSSPDRDRQGRILTELGQLLQAQASTAGGTLSDDLQKVIARLNQSPGAPAEAPSPAAPAAETEPAVESPAPKAEELSLPAAESAAEAAAEPTQSAEANEPPAAATPEPAAIEPAAAESSESGPTEAPAADTASEASDPSESADSSESQAAASGESETAAASGEAEPVAADGGSDSGRRSSKRRRRG